MDSTNLDRRHLLAGMAATAAIISLPRAATALSDRNTALKGKHHDIHKERAARMAIGFLEGN
jgi:hypothetical protein